MGRYTIVGPLGAGGVGIVYKAHDPELDRPVAIKLLSPGGHEPEATRQRAADLLREGRVAAQLAHPNVVRVYDVGDFGNELFIAMEFLEGCTLEAWQTVQQRSPAKILETYIKAGRGLAAAHRARLVHGDFKPRNVMVTSDSRVVVLDFGLGRPSGLETEPDLGEQTFGGTGGTPAYMAPELFCGETSSLATDQFAFCVSLYEALVGERPFGKLAAICPEGPPVAPPRRQVAPALWSVLRRGLALRPEQRFSSMDALLAGLAPRRTRARWGWAAGAAAIAGVTAYWTVADPSPTCDNGPQQFATVWTDGPLPELATRLDGDSWNFLQQRIDAYGERWAAEWTDACEARHIRGSQSSELFDSRMQCLQGGLAGVGAIAQALVAGSASASQAVLALRSLTPPASCGADVALLERDVATDPAKRVALAHLRRDIAADATLLSFPDQRKGILERTPDRLRRAQALGSNRSHARAEYNRAKSLFDDRDYEAASPSFRRAVHSAELAADDAFAARLGTFLVHIEAIRAHVSESRLWADYTRTKIQRFRDDDGYLALLLAAAEGVAARKEGDTERSVEVLQRALAAYPTTGGVAGTRADILSSLSVGYRTQRKHALAIETGDRALAAREALYGPNHPLVGESLYNLATARLVAGQPAAARALLDRATVILDADGASAFKTLAVANLLGPLLAEDGDLDGAARVLEAALKQARPELPSDAFALNPLLVNLSVVANSQGRHTEAAAFAKEALTIGESARGVDYPPLVTDIIALAKALIAGQQPAAAVPYLERGLQIADNDEARAELTAVLNVALGQAQPTPLR